MVFELIVQAHMRLANFDGVLKQTPCFWHGCAQHFGLKVLIFDDLPAACLHQRVYIHASFNVKLFYLIAHICLTLSISKLLLVASLGPLYSL